MTDDDKLFKQLNYFNPPILLLFFVRSGISFNLSALFSRGSFGALPLIWIGIGYFVIRIVGKFLGSFTGSRIVNTGVTVQKYLGFALIPQAGVAIGLAELGARALKGEMGEALLTIILASSVLYELIGPAAAKFALFRSGSYDEEDPKSNYDLQEDDNEPDEPKTQRKKNFFSPAQTDLYGLENVEEKFYDEAALEYYKGQYDPDEMRIIDLEKKKKNKAKKDKKKKSEKAKKK